MQRFYYCTCTPDKNMLLFNKLHTDCYSEAIEMMYSLFKHDYDELEDDVNYMLLTMWDNEVLDMINYTDILINRYKKELKEI